MYEPDEFRAAEIVRVYFICELFGRLLEYVIVYLTVGLFPEESVTLFISVKKSPPFIHTPHLLKSSQCHTSLYLDEYL